jgi:hypothetical protein
MIKLLADPRVFNVVIMALYACNIIRWMFAGSWADVSYWTSAFAITATVTFGYKHS